MLVDLFIAVYQSTLGLVILVSLAASLVAVLLYFAKFAWTLVLKLLRHPGWTLRRRK